MNPLVRLSAIDAARRIAAGTLTAEAYLAAHLERIAERDGAVQAFVSLDTDHALAQARAIDRARPHGPLAGVPVAFKDVIDTCDLPTQYNSPIYAGHRPRTDAACVALVRQAGGIVLGKTVTTEFATRTPGPTRNPHDLERSPGGSSSGSAAAVADCMAPLAFGTQTGGSNIRPAAYCGIVGYKPSFNTVNRAGLKPLAESLDTLGVMARSVEDCALLVHATSQRVLPDFSHGLPRPPRIGLHRTSRWGDASAETQALIERVAARLAAAGASVVEATLPPAYDRLYDDQLLIMNYEGARAFAHELRTTPELLSEELRNNLREYGARPRADYDAAMAHRRACEAGFAAAMGECDVWLTPSAPGVAPKGIGYTGSPLFNRNWTMLGVPCITLPAGRGEANLPLGVQLVARGDDDARLLRCAHWAQTVLRDS